MAIGIVAGVLLLPVVSDLVAIVRHVRGGPPAPPATHGPDGPVPPRLLFLVPAHDEELLIESCLRSLAHLRYAADRLTVVAVADNCADRTADRVRAAGVQCLERHSTALRGKPWAIAWALERLPLRDHDAVVIVDADSIVDPSFAAALAAAAPLADKAVQPYNDVRNRAENALTRMAAVLSTIRFRFMNSLKQHAGLNVPLANGLCIGTRVLATHGWTAFSICEDWEMYVILSEQGVRIESVPDARIYSQEASSLRQSSSQRRRWTAGRMAVLMRHVLALVRAPRVGLHQKLDVFAELTALGPSVHLGVITVLIALALLLQLPAAEGLALALGLSIMRPVVYTMAALRVDLEPARATRAFAFLPVYTVWRLAVQMAAVVTSGRTRWTRTDRRA